MCAYAVNALYVWLHPTSAVTAGSAPATLSEDCVHGTFFSEMEIRNSGSPSGRYEYSVGKCIGEIHIKCRRKNHILLKAVK